MTVKVRIWFNAVPGTSPFCLSLSTEIVALASSWLVVGLAEIVAYAGPVLWLLNFVLFYFCLASSFSVISSLLMIFLREIGLLS